MTIEELDQELRVTEKPPLGMDALKPELTEADLKGGMTPIEYLRKVGAATAPEIIRLKREDPHAFDVILKLTKVEMRAKGIPILGRYV